MKYISSDLKAALATGKIATLYKMTCKDGTSIHHTDLDCSVTYAGAVYEPAAGLSRVQLSMSVGSSVSSQSLASAWLAAPESELLAGKYDNAVVDVSWMAWEHPELGVLPVFHGHLGKIDWSADGFSAEIHSIQRDLGQRIGSEVTAQCRHVLGDALSKRKPGLCGVNVASYQFTGSITTVTSPVLLVIAVSTTKASGYFTSGIIQMTSGVANGQTFEIKNNADGTHIELCLPLPLTHGIVSGDTFLITAGCDGTYATCKSKFSNGGNFGGFPHIKVEAQWK